MTGFRVLLADDEEGFRAILEKRLSRRKLSVVCAASGEEALQVVKSAPVDVVVLDVRMPGMDGLEALRLIKEHDPTVEVIMLTGHANVEVAVRGIELGAFDYMMKPVDIDALLYRLEDAYKKRTLSRGTAKPPVV